ncbi:aminoacyl tRNA synthase complex-interacting multifunctional protein 1a isoform X1 [Stegostoma tigrinum]|uniref:aminoacyl tRNA synthase complex-interacting multifunctional protein 1a isoform X1 n=2 Tax=Stegostoma tigrinum TaxID=3053191 RepID=UPI00202AC8D3|nr:aminoacyl tRNA synthase complex-interacting multifunctional protein 1a isoform X1 [Stegostoma tigrinum]
MFLVKQLIRMSSDRALLNRLEQRAAEADQVIEYLKQQVALLKEKAILQASQREEKRLRVENAKLKKEIEDLKQNLIEAEIRNGVKRVPLPTAATVQSCSAASKSPTTALATPTAAEQTPEVNENKKKKDKPDKKPDKKGEKKQTTGGGDDSKPIDISRLDLRIGRIITAKKHPDADSLFVEEVDVGEENPRTVVSGLVNHVPVEEMQNRLAVMLCNLKPAKMRGVVSQAMVMCASSPEKVEILDPPSDAVPGDRVTFEGYPGDPDKELNPKKKVWDQIQPNLGTNEECVATYKGTPFEVKGKGVCKAQTMANSGIK